MKKFRKTLLRATGSSLAEFAVVSALMATLAATAMPKLSALTERAKAEKTMKEIDKMLNMAQTYFNVSGTYADGSATRIESIADLATAMAGTNLTASSGQLVAGAAGAGIGLVIALS